MAKGSPTANQVSASVDILFGKDVRTRSDWVLVRICQISGFITFLLPPFETVIDKLPHPGIVVAETLYFTSFLVFIFTFAIFGMHSVGRQAGKQTYAAQIFYTVGRTCLFLLLPALAITLALFTWAYLTHQPGVRP